MKYFFYGFTLVFIVLVVMVGHKQVEGENVMGNTNEYIEYIKDGTPTSYIIRANLPSWKTQEVFNANRDGIALFDISPNGKERIISIFKMGDIPEDQLILLQNDNSLHVVMSSSSRCPSFSPNGKSVSFLSRNPGSPRKNWVDDWYLHLINTDGTSNKQISKLSFYQMKPSWFPDGKHIAIASKDLGIFIIDVNTGKEQKIIDFGIGPVVSHDGKKIAYLSKEVNESMKKSMVEFQKITQKEYDEAYTEKKKMELSRALVHYSIYIYDMNTKKSTKITKEIPIENAVIWSPDDRYLLYNDRTKLSGERVYILDTQTTKVEKIPDVYGRVMGWGTLWGQR